MAAYDFVGLGLFRSPVRGQLGEALLLAGRVEDALEPTEHALAFARQRAERGHEAYAQRILGEIASHPDSFDATQARTRYAAALKLAKALGMRPLAAHCHLGLGRVYQRERMRTEAEEHVAIAEAVYRDIGMRFRQERASAIRSSAH